ncbi:protein YgfX [Zophobihabitans entericus]|uniref:Uncharacterized protein n=1 Tax=Zophobihabitans entericus TaxID=1635327 RepID=A0A6G9IBF6_9GAMM|nr:protein YgfX [Zophobihabitans entericus]QIQ21561.1 hypothetical protein IPMB12_07600 [Zophobihabitans entericus]
MWQAELTRSVCLYLLCIVFYSSLFGFSIYLSWHIHLGLTFLLGCLFIFEFYRGYKKIIQHVGAIAIDLTVQQIYWQKQRWVIRRKPLLLRYFAVVSIQSLRTKKRCTLLISYDQLTSEHWRSCCYYLERLSQAF